MQKVNPDVIRRAAEARRKHGSERATAAALGVPRSTLQHWLHLHKQERAKDGKQPIYEPYTSSAQDVMLAPELHEITDDLPDYDKVKRRLADTNQAYIDDFHASRNIHLKVRHEIFLQFFIGDLHRDSPGHDDDQFEADMGLIRRAQKSFQTHVINMGDILDNWPTGGRLGKKHHDSHLTRKEALALVKGFMQSEGLDFTLHILGNHDAWPGVDFQTLLKQWTPAPVVDWGAFLHVTTDQGWLWRTFAAHDMKGSSIHNPIHGLARRAREDGESDLYVAGHRHVGGQGKDQNGFRARTYNYMRVRGYKRADEYGWVLGHGEEEEGATGLAVINPNARMQDGQCRVFYDLEEGLDWARLLKRRAK